MRTLTYPEVDTSKKFKQLNWSSFFANDKAVESESGLLPSRAQRRPRMAVMMKSGSGFDIKKTLNDD
jgi:hypothetical protein|eukprot:scaffold1873_cov311-Alexandrium_tamarense.AAC.3